VSEKPMDSRELGLVLARQLFGLEDLHYGLWEDDLELSVQNAPLAQQRYNDMLLAQIPDTASGTRILDVGCGTGHLLHQMLEHGHRVDGVVPAAALCDAARKRVRECAGYTPRIHECRFQHFPAEEFPNHYDVVLFSESFQYIPMADSLSLVSDLLRPRGLLIICDFFKTDAHGTGGVGDRSFGGGHSLIGFYERIAESPFELVLDRDITEETGRTLHLVNDLLMNRVGPASQAIHRYLDSNYPLTTRMARRLFRKRLQKIKYKYFSGHRSKAVFERYKSYRLLTYRRA